LKKKIDDQEKEGFQKNQKRIKIRQGKGKKMDGACGRKVDQAKKATKKTHESKKKGCSGVYGKEGVAARLNHLWTPKRRRGNNLIRVEGTFPPGMGKEKISKE